ncbi:MAG: response regulator [Desulfovibrio sp.]|jgi:signal transduction histidine kinase/DNA-binding response OmpR family regulator|nr:response regulator [Desulfovibrio sp.]
MREKIRTVSIQLINLAIAAVFVGVTAAMIFLIIMPGMRDVMLWSERQYLNEQLLMVDGVLRSDIDALALRTYDLALWEETCLYLRGENPRYHEKHWSGTTMSAFSSSNYFIVQNHDGSMRFTEFYDYLKHRYMSAPQGFFESVSGLSRSVIQRIERHGWPKEAGPAVGLSGIIIVGDTAYSIAVMPIAEQFGGKVFGTLLSGKVLSDEFFRSITHFDRITYRVSRDMRGLTGAVLAEAPLSDGDTASTWVQLTDIYGYPLKLSLTVRRDIFLEGQRFITKSSISYLVLLLLCAGVLSAVRQKLIVAPVKEMNAAIAGLGINERIDITPYRWIREYAEQGTVINAMLDRLDFSETANRAKSDFLATVSHEIRTPLNAVLGLAEIELQNDLPEETRLNIEKIYISGSNLLGIINDILDISKIETGSFKLIDTEYELTQPIDDAVQLNKVRIGSKRIIFEIEPDKTLPCKLYGDEIRVRQILNNLLSNAFKYTQEGKVVLEINWERCGEDHAWIIIRVSDTGIGIREEEMVKLFSAYSQLDTKANRRIEGTGLGLAITRTLVQMMGGEIGVESEYGKGSVFTARILQKIADAAPIGEATAEALKTFRFIESRRIRGAGLVRSYMPYGRILVVDDVPTNLDVAKGLMIPYGLTVDFALSGAAAIRMIREEKTRYDVVFMDHMMPEMDGVEATRIIRNEIGTEYAETVPIIAMTANALSGSREKLLSSGFDAYISKPIDIVLLDAILNQWVRDKQSTETLREAACKRPEKSAAASPSLHPVIGQSPEGVNLELCVKRYEGESAYLQIIRSYVLHTPALLDAMRSVSEENLEKYKIMVHGLKSATYGICADALGRRAAALEQAAIAGDYATVLADNGDFLGSVDKLLDDLRKLLKKVSEEKTETEKPRAPSPDKLLLQKLADDCALFRTSEMEATLLELEGYAYESGGELVAWLREQLDNLEYDAMLERLQNESGEGGSAYGG